MVMSGTSIHAGYCSVHIPLQELYFVPPKVWNKFLRAVKTIIVFRPEIGLQDYCLKSVPLFMCTIIYITEVFVKYYWWSFKCFLIFDVYLGVHIFNTFTIMSLGQIPKSGINGQRVCTFYVLIQQNSYQ